MFYSNNNTAIMVSVVIPIYNKGKYVHRALSSVLSQTHPFFEIIVVDDGSTDNGTEKVLEFDDPRILLIKQENKGPGAARNAGLVRARGKYVAFLDADDEWLPSFLEIGIKWLEDSKANISVVCAGFYYYPSMKKLTFNIKGEEQRIFEIHSDTDVKFVRKILDSIWTCTSIIRTDVVNNLGGFYDRYRCVFGEDVFLFYKILFNERIGIISKPLGIYHTEASDLYGGGMRNIILPVPPYLEDPTDILNVCPANKLHILKDLLVIKAFIKVIDLANKGQTDEAKHLFKRFYGISNKSLKQFLKVLIYIKLSPALPVLIRFKQSCKSVIKQLRAMLLD
jgi:glycosyltransferase involved in cell wall biosynthesis